METETYLNLGSEQFNSWINEFENKYHKIEKTNASTINSVSSNENIDLSDKNDDEENKLSEGSDIEQSSDSDSEQDPEVSNVFISQSKISEEENDTNTENTSNSISSNRRLIFNRHFYRRNNSSSQNNTIENIDDLKEQILKNKDLNSPEKSIIKENINSNTKKLDSNNFIKIEDKIMSLKELNNILPKGYKNKIKEELKEQKIINNSKEDSKSSQLRLGEKALYRYIALRRR